ncbi:TonB-dependent receptor [uncultured Sphingomonas sp.]|uniref:TonB-dependent receptor n=1 Tax=uncultured Sphingomonas sp. TaxID=158754 RepID=UPI0035CA25F9
MKATHLTGVAMIALLAGGQGQARAQSASSQTQAGNTTSMPAGAAGQTSEAGAGQGGNAAPGQVEGSPPAQGASGLADIVVTAQRVSENSQRAAVAIDVVGGADLLKAGASSVDRLTSLVPALTVPSAGSYNYYFIRGVGNFASTSYSDPAVAFNYDGVYVGRPTSAAGVFYDLDRIEVLKGPQGTLYGRNATGGAINVLPTQPKLGEFSGFGSVSYGDYNALNFQGAVNVPMGDKGALRISTNIVDRGAYLSDGESNEKVQAGRFQLKSELTPQLTVRVSGDYAHVGGAGNGYGVVDSYKYDPTLSSLPLGQRFDVTPSGIDPSQGVFSPASQAYLQAQRAGPSGRNLNALPAFPYQANNFYGANAQIDYQTGLGTLTVVPAYRYSKLNDLGGTLASVLDKETAEQTSVEVRLGKTGVGIFDYNVGIYYFDESIKDHLAVNQEALAVQQNYTTGTESYAGFGRLTVHIGQRLRLVGGARYTHDDKRFNGQSNRVTIVCTAGNCPTAPLFPFFNTFADIPFALPAFGVASGVGPVAGTRITRGDVVVNASQSIGKGTYRGAVEFDLAPRSLLYASVETGYRSGGFSLASGYETYQPEYITAYTAGSKNRFFDNRLQLNFEGFYWKYRNQQISHVGIDNTGQQGNFTQNIGTSSIKGGEAEVRLLVTPTTELSADLQYLSTKYDSFTYLAPVGTAPPYTTCAVSPTTGGVFYNVDCSGKPAYNSPKWTLNLAAQKTVPIGDYKVVFGADTQLRSSQYIGFEYRPAQLAPYNSRTNATISFGDARDRWTISGFVRNIEGDRTPTFASNVSIGSLDAVITSPPRTYGVRLGAKF